jgi:hypothetical protein
VVKQNVLWTTGRFEGALVHTIAVYIPPGDKDEAYEIIRNLHWILYRIFILILRSVTGDFNRVGLSFTDFLHDEYDIKRVIQEDIPTHSLGNNLDGFWTNLEVASTALISELTKISDHSLILVKLKIGTEIRRTIPQKIDEYVAPKDIRKFLAEDADIRALL